MFWNEPGYAFTINFDATMLASFQTNMFQSGIMTISTPIAGGSGGWGNYTNAFSFPLATPLDGHLTGLSAANFLTTPGAPYNLATFAPIPGSALIGAGSALTNPEVSKMPVRFQPDTVNGYMIARTAPTTIGAVESGTQPTLSSLAVSPGTVSVAVGAVQYYTAACVYSNGMTEDCTQRATWSSTNSTAMIFWGAQNPIGAAYVAGSGYVQANFAGMTGSSPFAIGGATLPPAQTTTPPTTTATVAAPTFSTAAGSYTGTQNVTITTATSGASVVYTSDGTTPSVTSSCATTNGTLYVGPVAVSA